VFHWLSGGNVYALVPNDIPNVHQPYRNLAVKTSHGVEQMGKLKKPVRDYITVDNQEMLNCEIQASLARTGGISCGHFVLIFKRNPNSMEVAQWKSCVKSSF
jgi:hypothetical protein